MRALVLILLAACGQPQAVEQRCTVRVARDGIFVDGAARTRDEAVALCRKTAGATVTVEEGTAPETWRELRAALQATGTKIFERGPVSD